MLTDFSILPEVEFCERDTGEIAAAVITTFEGLMRERDPGYVIYPGDPVHKFLLTLAAGFAQFRVIVDYTGKQNLLRYAQGPFLEHLGAMLGVTRLKASAAETTIRYELQAPLAYSLMIPFGNRTTADSKMFWATKRLAGLRAGDMHVDVPAVCLTPGAVGNGLVAGQINKIVDPINPLIRARNLTETTGGADIEKDDPFRNRIRLAPESFTVAGSELAYVFWALTAHPDIADVSCYSQPLLQPGDVNVMVLLSGGRIPDPEGPEIAAVKEMISGKKVRPLTDRVYVLPPETIEVDFRIQYYISEPQVAYAPSIDAMVKQAVSEYEKWQTEIIGRDLNPDELIRACKAAGAKRIVPELLDESGEVVERMKFRALTRQEVVRFAERDDRVVFAGVEGI